MMVEIRKAAHQDIEYICHLQRIECNRQGSVGWLPRMAYEKEINAGGALFIGMENDDEVGYIYATHNNHGVTRIQQLVVQDDARRLEIGTEFVDIVTRPTDWSLTLRCRSDLPSAAFWSDLGFQVTGVDNTPNKRKAGILRFNKIVGGLWVQGMGE